MKGQHIASVVIASASIFVGGITLAAQDKYTLKSLSGISFFGIQGLRGLADDCRGPVR